MSWEIRRGWVGETKRTTVLVIRSFLIGNSHEKQVLTFPLLPLFLFFIALVPSIMEK